MTMVAVASLAKSRASWLPPIKISLPPRAATSCIFEIVFSSTPSLGAMTITGMSVDERDRSMFQFSRRIPLGMNIGDFLEFQRAFERQGIGRSTAKVEHVPHLGDFACQNFDGALAFERLRD